MKTLYYKFMGFAITWFLRLLPRKSQIVYQGRDSAVTLAAQVAVLGFDKVIIVTDQFLGGSGILDGIKQKLGESGVNFVVFDGVLPNPTWDQVREGEALARKEQCQAVIAVGGGSVIDAAKMIAMLQTNEGSLEKFDGIQLRSHPGLPLFAVPSTAGTGSEATPGAVISDPASHRKALVFDNKIIPDYVALDPEIMKGMPPGVTAATGMDALSHAVESYLSKASTPSTEVQAKASVRLIFRYLVRAFREGSDLEAREGMAVASYFGGVACAKTGVGYVHGIAHQLGRVCDTPHGNANAMVMPEVLAAYGAPAHERLADLALLVGVGEKGDLPASLAGKFVQAIIDMRRELELPLKPQGLEAQHIPGIVDEAIAEASGTYPVPRYMSGEEIRAIVIALLPT